MDKCTHESSIVISDHTGFSLLRCTWGCGQDLIQIHLSKHEVKTFTADELIVMDAVTRAAKDLHIKVEYLAGGVTRVSHRDNELQGLAATLALLEAYQ